MIIIFVHKDAMLLLRRLIGNRLENIRVELFMPHVHCRPTSKKWDYLRDQCFGRV